MYLTEYCNCRMAATFYKLQTWVVPGIKVTNNNNNNNNKLIPIVISTGVIPKSLPQSLTRLNLHNKRNMDVLIRPADWTLLF